MAWHSSSSTNTGLIDNMFKNGLITSPIVAEAMKKVDRKHYVPFEGRSEAYMDSPQSIGFNATISAPHMHAHALENLLPFLTPSSSSSSQTQHQPRRILDVGSGSGYLTACLAHLINPSSLNGVSQSDKDGDGDGGALVVGIDHLESLVMIAKKNLERDGIVLGPQKDGINGKKGKNGDVRVEVVCGDGREGYSKYAPYDAIHVGAASPSLPQALVDQLKSPGRMFIPIGPPEGHQDVWQVDKDEEGRVGRRRLFGVRYVPLTSAKNQWNE